MRTLVLIITLSLCTHPAYADSKCYSERIRMTSYSAELPQPIIKPRQVIPLGCERSFLYRGNLYAVDSHQAKDAANLREQIRTVPEADEILARYQKNRNNSNISAYTGTFGLLLLLFAGPISKQFSADSRDSVKSLLHITGISLAAGGFVYGIILIKSNESLIQKAVDQYNNVKPNDRIELQFTAGWSF